MGPDHEEHHGGNHHLDDHDHDHTTTETHKANNDGGQDSHDSSAHDSGGHGGDSCCNGKCVLDTLIGKDSTSFAVLIKDVTDVLKTTRLAKRRVSLFMSILVLILFSYFLFRYKQIRYLIFCP